MEKRKYKNKKVVIVVSGMILAVSIGAVGFKYKNAIVSNNSSIQNEAYSQNQDNISLMAEEPEQIDILENKLWQIKINNHDNFVILSDGFITLENYNYNKLAYEGPIKKYDFDGNLIFDLRDKITPVMEEITSTGAHDETEPEVWGVRENPNNNNLLVFVRGTAYADSFWLEFDKDGNYIRMVDETSDTYLGYVPDMLECFSDGIIVADYTSGTKKIDYNGNLVWNGDSSMPRDKLGVVKTGDNYEILAYDEDNNNISLFKLNSSGEVISNKILIENENMSINTLSYNSNSKSVTSYDDGFIITFTEYDRESRVNKLRIVKVDLEGNIIWDKTEDEIFNDYTRTTIRISNCLSDGFAIIADPESEGLIIKRYDINGNLVEDRTSITSGEFSIPTYSKYVFLVGDKILFTYNDSSYNYLVAVKSTYLNRSALDEILEEVGQLEESDYSDESWDKLQQAITGLDDLTSQDEIDAKVDEIQDAIDNLGVDRSALDKLIEDAGKLTQTDYSTASWQVLQNALTGTDNLTKQSEIDAKVNEIQTAMTNLTVDRSALNKLIEDAGKLIQTDYSTTSWQVLQNALTGTDDLTKQSEIDAKVTEIQTAMTNLTVDRSALDKLIEDASKLTQTDYSTASWQALQDALTGTDNLTKQSEIDAKVNEIQTAITNLAVDRSALDKIIEDAGKLDQTDYSATSWQTLQDALTGTDNLTKQSEIDAKVNEIQSALNNLVADRSELDSLLEEVGQLEESDYSDESWQKLQDAIAGAEDLTNPDEIDDKVEEIQEALDNLGVDKSELDSLLEEVGQLEESDYSDESWQKLQDAISGAEDLTKQSEIDDKVEEIQEALDNLGVDKSELNSLLEEVGQLEKSDYSDESWQALQDAISGAEDLTKQSEIDAKVDEIQNALDNLGVDKSELDSLLEEVGQLEKSDYSDESWQALQGAIAGAEDLTKQSEIDAKVDEIQAAITNLTVDRSELDKLIEDAGNLNKSDYSKESWQALQDALTGTDNLTKQSEIDAKVNEIQSALNNLGVDRSVLDTLLDNISKLNSSDYSDESWQALQDALTGTDNLTKQSEIDAKVDEIKKAIEGLGIDRSDLDSLLEEVGQLVESDYSKDSWNVLENAVKLSDAVTTQSQVNDAIELIKTAIEGLTIDRSQLDKLLEDVKKLNSSDYSNESWQALQQTLTGTDNLTKQSEIDTKVKEIQDAIDKLGADTSELDRLLEEISNLEERDYSVESWSNLQQVAEGADKLTKQDEINKKVDELQKAIDSLSVNRSELDAIIQKVESMDSSKYVADSWKNLESLLNVDGLSKQYEIDQRVKEIEEAINKLVLDMSKLDDLIEQSEGLNKDDYTEDTWNNFEQTVDEIKDKINNNEINEGNIDEYVTKLQDALNSLKINENKGSNGEQNVDTSDTMNMGIILAFLASLLGIIKNIKKFIFKK